MAADDGNEYIIVQTDTRFSPVLLFLADLKMKDCLPVQSVQEAVIENIESANENDADRFVFGGQVADMKVQAFCRTASSALRMCMMRSANMTPYPNLSVKSLQRNRNKMQYTQSYGERFTLTINPVATRMYFSRYDHLHPHFLLAHLYKAALPTRWWTMGLTMMLIFRKDFTEYIEFTTAFCAGERSDIKVGTFKSYVKVTCIFRKISGEKTSAFIQEILKYNKPEDFASAQKTYLKEIPKENTIPNPRATNAPDPGVTDVPDPGATDVPDPGATDIPDPGATDVPDPGATDVPDPSMPKLETKPTDLNSLIDILADELAKTSVSD